MGVPVQAATGTSLAIVGLNAAAGAVASWRGGRSLPKTGFAFGISGLLGALGGAWLNHQLPGELILILFSVLMVVAAVGMLRRDNQDTSARRVGQGLWWGAKWLLRTVPALLVGAVPGFLSTNPQEMAESRRVLKPDGVLAVSANDYEAAAVSPAGSAIERMFSFYPRVMTHNGGNRLLARHLRGALLEAGFARAEGHAGVDLYGTPERVRSYAAGMAEVARGSGFVKTVLSQGWADQAEMAALPDEILRWGERPDANRAVLKCGALGWVDHRSSRLPG